MLLTLKHTTDSVRSVVQSECCRCRCFKF